MKLPRFSLRLVLLIIALVAVVVSWRRAALLYQHEAREAQAFKLQEKLERLEPRRRGLAEFIQTHNLPETYPASEPNGYSETLQSYDRKIGELKQQIDDLRH